MSIKLLGPLTNSYGDWIEECERRHKAGQRQSICTKCSLWRWPDEVCCGAPRKSSAAFHAEVREIVTKRSKG